METNIVLDNSQIIHVEKPVNKIACNDWSKKSLRYCLHALGLTDKEIRYRAGVRFLIDSWVGETDILLDLIKQKWKEQAITHHEANGGDVEQWKNVNSLYSAILKKLSPQLKHVSKLKDSEIIYECIICGKSTVKQVKSLFQLNSKLCNNPECHRIHHNLKAKKLREKRRIYLEKFCLWRECGNRFLTTHPNKKFCCPEHLKKFANERDRPKKLAYDRLHKKSWAARWRELSPEEQARRRAQHWERAKLRRENETPEQRAKRLERIRIYARKRRQNLSPEQKMEINAKRKISEAELIEKKRQQWIDKPWIFETWLITRKEKKKQYYITRKLKRKQNTITTTDNNSV